MILTKCLIISICCSFKSEVSRIASLKLPVLVHQQVVGLPVLFLPSIPAVPHSLVMPLDVGVDPSTGGFAFVGVTRFGIHTVSAEWGADRPILKITNLITNFGQYLDTLLFEFPWNAVANFHQMPGPTLFICLKFTIPGAVVHSEEITCCFHSFD